MQLANNNSTLATSKKAKRVYTSQYKNEICEEYRASGQKLTPFCKKHGIPHATLNTWLTKNKVAKQNKPYISGFLPISLTDDTSSTVLKDNLTTININNKRLTLTASLPSKQLINFIKGIMYEN